MKVFITILKDFSTQTEIIYNNLKNNNDQLVKEPIQTNNMTITQATKCKTKV